MEKNKIETILDDISQLNLLETSELVAALEKKFNISAASYQQPLAPVAPASVAEEKDEFDVILESFEGNKINIIKEVRAISDLGLKEAKEAVENLPFKVKSGANKKEAEELKTKLSAAGAVVVLK